jgi:hypothetical protein
MPTVRALGSVAHDIAHHAASSVSWLHPHAGKAARAAGMGELRFDLLAVSPLDLPSLEGPLRAATDGLQRKLVEMLEKHGFAKSILQSAVLVMQFPTSSDDYCVTISRLETTARKIFEKTSSSLG